MKIPLNRRGFVQGALILTGSVTSAETWLNWLNDDLTPALLFSILQTHLGLKDKDAALMPAFLERLKTPGVHTETVAQLNEWIQHPEHRAELSAYVLEEFVVASNYFEVQSGAATELCILPVQAGHQSNLQHLV